MMRSKDKLWELQTIELAKRNSLPELIQYRLYASAYRHLSKHDPDRVLLGLLNDNLNRYMDACRNTREHRELEELKEYLREQLREYIWPGAKS